MESIKELLHKSISVYILIITLLTVCLLPVTAISFDKPDYRVNDDGGTSDQNDPRIAVSADGGFVIVWIDKRAGNGKNDVYLQRFDSTGTALSNNIKINDNDTAWQAVPAIASDLAGEYAVVWEDYRTEGYPFNPDIFYQPLDSLAAPVGANINVTPVYPEARRETPDIALSSWSTGVVVWADDRNGNWDIYGQLIDLNGSPVGSNFKINDDIGSQPQHAPRVSVSSLGWFVVVWYDKRSGNDDIYVQRFNASGQPLGANLRVNTDATAMRQTFPDVATDGAGHFTVVWVDYRNSSYPDIWTCKFDTNMISEEGNVRLTTSLDRTQRYPSIAADRMGNVSIIWSDETSSTWDIVGQMIDVDGVVREIEFTANEYSDSMKIKPDVALNGSHRFITWVDRRRGNFDIYASISKYNDPGLVVQPTALDFQMVRGNGVPAPQYINVSYVGYNRLGFKAITFDSWLTLSPSTATTPDSIAVGIASDMMSDGTYLGNIMFIDTLNHDSTNIVSVRLEVISGQLNISKDSITFRTLVGMDTTFTDEIGITNGGVGVLNWTATEQADWLSLSSEAGTAPSIVHISVNTTLLTEGTYTEPIIIDAGNAVNSPDTVWVTVQVQSDIPKIVIEPETIQLSSNNPGSIDTFVVIKNNGGSVLNWTAMPDDSWLLLDHNSGADNDTVRLSVNASLLSPGLWNTNVDFVDSNAINIKTSLSIALDFVEDYVDTVSIGSVTVRPGNHGVMNITAMITSQVVHLFLPLQYDTGAIVVDSFSFGNGLPIFMSRFYQVNPSNSMITINLERNPPDMYMAPGSYQLGRLFFSAKQQPGVSTVDTLNSDSLFAFITTFSGSERYPIITAGDITIESSPILEVSADSLFFELPEGYDTTVMQQFGISNAGIGELHWTANEQASWLALSAVSGTNTAIVQVLVNASLLSAGDYVESIVIEADSAGGSPDTLWVTLSVRNDLPLLAVEPASIFLNLTYPYETDTFAVIKNNGGGNLSWQAESNYPWLQLNQTTGSDGDTVYLSINGVTLPGGISTAYIDFIDSNSVNIQSCLTLQAELAEEDFMDTITVTSADVAGGDKGIITLSASLSSRAQRIFLPFGYDSAIIMVDSLVFGADLPAFLDKSVQINQSAGGVIVDLQSLQPDSFVVAGEYQLGVLHFTAQYHEGVTGLEVLNEAGTYPFISTISGNEIRPVVLIDQFHVNTPTDVDDLSPDQLPKQIYLYNNYPNPFNPNTVIRYDIPVVSEVVIEVFNILGQKVKTLVSWRHQPGRYSITWDGKTAQGWEAPSGVYFYRLQAGETSKVSKMVLLR